MGPDPAGHGGGRLEGSEVVQPLRRTERRQRRVEPDQSRVQREGVVHTDGDRTVVQRHGPALPHRQEAADHGRQSRGGHNQPQRPPRRGRGRWTLVEGRPVRVATGCRAAHLTAARMPPVHRTSRRPGAPARSSALRESRRGATNAPRRPPHPDRGRLRRRSSWSSSAPASSAHDDCGRCSSRSSMSRSQANPVSLGDFSRRRAILVRLARVAACPWGTTSRRSAAGARRAPRWHRCRHGATRSRLRRTPRKRPRRGSSTARPSLRRHRAASRHGARRGCGAPDGRRVRHLPSGS